MPQTHLDLYRLLSFVLMKTRSTGAKNVPCPCSLRNQQKHFPCPYVWFRGSVQPGYKWKISPCNWWASRNYVTPRFCVCGGERESGGKRSALRGVTFSVLRNCTDRRSVTQRVHL